MANSARNIMTTISEFRWSLCCTTILTVKWKTFPPQKSKGRAFYDQLIEGDLPWGLTRNAFASEITGMPELNSKQQSANQQISEFTVRLRDYDEVYPPIDKQFLILVSSHPLAVVLK
ncbi:hypothetical protein [Dyadobacter sp. OTU695]|uniref:hypothetical protein n=1 Tax=Dyadobacter sp. OTU695 TaxID=3043860 RepID=UPI00313AD525